MSRPIAILVFLSTAVVAGPLAAAAEVESGIAGQTVCSTRANVLSHLSKKYAETPVALGVAENGGVIELLTSAQGNTWTIIVTMPNGKSCMVAAGEGWEQVPRMAAKEPGT
ncbi:MAG: hypothetical protein WCF16_07205 [Alphaproteobacteria bacterium]